MTTQIKPRPLEENASYTRFGHNSKVIQGVPFKDGIEQTNDYSDQTEAA